MKGLLKFDIEALLADVPPRKNLNVAYVDGAYAMRIAKIRDTFPRHYHPVGDEGWFVHRGRMRIDSDQGSVDLGTGEGALVPQGVKHSVTCLEEGTLVLVINRKGFEMIPDDPQQLAGTQFNEEDLR